MGVYSCHEAIRREAFFGTGGFHPEYTKDVYLGEGHSEYHDTITDQEQQQYQCNAKISLGRQPMILGFINSVLPYYASVDGTGKQAPSPAPEANHSPSPTLFCRAMQPQFAALRKEE